MVRNGYFRPSWNKYVFKYKLWRHNLCPCRHQQNYICDSKYIVDVIMWPKLYTSVEKGIKLKVRKFWGLILEFADVTGKKLGDGGLFAKFLTREKSIILDFRLGSEYTSAE